MKKAMLLLAATALLALSGCKSNCAKVQDQCDECSGANGKKSCQASHDICSDNGDCCKVILDLNSYASDSAYCKQ
jgi:protein involved in sex pheromone biosynthesis